MNNYNIHLSELRKKANLSLKEAAKAIGVNRYKLYLYENGYFRPTKKDLVKLSEYYKEEISLEGEKAYPGPVKEKQLKKVEESLKVKRIVFGSLSIAVLLSILAGGITFNNSVSNKKSYYGDTYNAMREKVVEHGETGYDIATSLKYHYVSGIDSEFGESSIIFYETDNILYFNECSYTTIKSDSGFDTNRYRYQFGFNLGVSSFTCEFNYGSILSGEYFTCYFDYEGKPVEKVDKFKILVTDGKEVVTEEKAVELVNSELANLEDSLSELLSNYLGKETSFFKDFLPAREQGRKINFSLQITGLLLIIPGIIAFYIVFGIFIKLLIKNIRPRLVETEPNEATSKHEKLPNDLHINFGIPDIFIVLLGKILQFGSIFFFLVALIAKVGVPFLKPFSNPILLTVFSYSLLAGIFLEHFVMIGRIKKPTTLFQQIIYNLGFFLFVATIETVLISLTNAWGYELAPLIYKYVPGNVYQIVAVHYLIFLFLFFQPPFLNKKGKIARIIWHSLSLIPLGFLITTYVLSNSYALVYGVKENIFINFWFPNGFLSLSLVCVIFLYATFGVRLFYEKKYGKGHAQTFFYGDRYTIIENAMCACLIIIAAIIDLAFQHNQYAYYLGLGKNVWLFALVPFIILCKYSPNNQQIFLIDEQLKTFSRE